MLFTYVKMKKIILLILFIFMGLLLAQKEVNDPFGKWKEYKIEVDTKVRKDTYSFRKNTKKCAPFHNVKVYTYKDTLILVSVNSCGICGCNGYGFYYQANKLRIVRRFTILKPKAPSCEKEVSINTLYYLDDQRRIVNFKELVLNDKTEEALLLEIEVAEKKMQETLKKDCLD